MRLVVKILLAATAVAMTACRDLPDYLVSDNTVAKVGRKELKINEIMEAMPANVKGDDSVSFVKLYVDKWLVRQLKVEEAVAIRWHMGGFDDAVRGGSFAMSGAFEKYPLAVKLHISDLEATYLMETR